jgi:hypothetical protein
MTSCPDPTPAALRLAELHRGDAARRAWLAEHAARGCLGCPACWPVPLAVPVGEVLDALGIPAPQEVA